MTAAEIKDFFEGLAVLVFVFFLLSLILVPKFFRSKKKIKANDNDYSDSDGDVVELDEVRDAELIAAMRDSKDRNDLYRSWSERNKRGYRLEKSGKIAEAIAIYKGLIAEGFDGGYPYERLAIIYRKSGDFQSEASICSMAIAMLQEASITNSRVIPELEKFVSRLQKAEKKLRDVSKK